MNYRSLLLACAAMLGLAVAGWGQADGKIAFLSHRAGYNDVWVMNADGSDPVNLTQGQYCASPVWSPDGTQIVYLDVGADRSSRDIWVIDVAGGKPRQLTDDIKKIGPNSADDLFWSEDGSSIYYHVWDRSEMFAVAPDGSGAALMDWSAAALILRRFWETRNISPDATKRATFVVLGGDEEGQALIVYNTNADRQITDARAITLFTPVGQPDDVDLSSWTPGAWLSSGALSSPTWAPNGTRIAFTSYTILSNTSTSFSFLPSTGEIWAVDIDGSNLVNLTNGLGGDHPVWQPRVPAATSVEAQSWGQVKLQLAPSAR